MKILVTGTPGSGKTTLVKYALNLENAKFVDADYLPSLCEWRNFKTGAVYSPVDSNNMPIENIYESYGWYWKDTVLKAFLIKNQNAIICGSSENIVDFYNLFDRIVVLAKTKDELEVNLNSPDRINFFGNTNSQRAGFLEWQNYLIQQAKAYQAIIIQNNDISKIYSEIIGLQVLL